MFCTNCGSQLEDGTSVCPNCGCQVADGNELQQAEAIHDKGNGGKKKWLCILIPIVAIVIIGVCIICNAAYLNNFIRRTFSSPESYYRYIEKKEAEKTAQTLASIYDNVVRSSFDISDKSVEGSIKAELGDDVCGMLSEAADLDLDWAKSLELKYNSTAKNKDCMYGGNVELFLGENSVISAQSIVDGGEEMLYMQVPEMTSKYMALDMKDTLDFDSFEDSLQILGEVYEKTPDKKAMEQMLYRYFCKAIECIDGVEKDKDILEVGEISKNYLTLTAEIDSDTMQEMAEAVLGEMREDEQLENLMKTVVPLLDETIDGDDLYDDFEDSLEEVLDNLEEIGDSDAKLTMTIWVDGKGTIHGRSIKVNGMKIYYALPQKGSGFGLEAGIKTNDGSIVLSGEGKCVGSKLNGEFKAKIIGVKIADIEMNNLDLIKMKEGYLNGEFIVQPSSKLGMAGAVAAILADYSYQLAVVSGKDMSEIRLAVLDGDESLGSVSISTKVADGGKLTVPSDEDVIELEGYGDFADWTDEVDWDAFFSHLHDAGVPSDIVDDMEDTVEEQLDALKTLYSLGLLDDYMM